MTTASRRHARRRLTVLATVAALVLAACGSGSDAGAGDAGGSAPAGAEQAVGELPVRAFTTSTGDQATLADFAGKPMVVNFFASWCPPCRAEMPDFQEVHAAAGDDVQFFGFAMQDTERAAAELVEETGVTYPFGFDPDGSLYRDFEGFSMPTTLYVSAEGEILGRDNGPVDAGTLRDRLEEHFGIRVA